MPSERATELADEFAAVNAEIVTFAASCTEAQWQTMVPGEEWPVGVVLHHIAEGHAQGLRWLETMARGEAVTDTQDDIDGRNMEHARRSADIGQAETVQLLEANGALVEAALRRLDDGDLARMAPFGPAGGRSFPVGDFAAVTYQHGSGHFAHAKAALGLSD
jgi:DinB family protein